MMYFHIPVLAREIIETINPEKNENLIDGTLGGGSHAKLILEKTGPNGKLLGIDLDNEALIESKRNLEKYSNRVIFEKGNFVDVDYFIEKNNFNGFHIFFLDLGFSSQQLNNDSIGISFLKKAPLDMRIGGRSGGCRITAEDIVNNYSEEKIKSIIKDYGEEKHAILIARQIVKARKEKRIVNTLQLVNIISDAISQKYKNQKIHFATRTFQALRIVVNSELDNLEIVLPKVLDRIKVGGRICVISFHSLEDRIVKKFFQKESKDCICDLKVPICSCGHKKRLKLITKKSIQTGIREVSNNPRSRSAKLRVAKKIK